MPQDSENWTLLQTLFDLAERTPEPDRERVLEEHCADPELRRRVITILHGASLDEPTKAPDSNPSARTDRPIFSDSAAWSRRHRVCLSG